MTIREVAPAPGAEHWLPGVDFSDAFMVEIVAPGLDARGAAEAMLTQSPRWVSRLMRWRNALVKPLGLKRPEPAVQPHPQMIGVFPVVSESPDRIVVGFDDRHLDFRVIIDVLTALDGKRKRVTATTLVARHNRTGGAYLAVIKPFHRRVTRALLKQLNNIKS